jgi:hypothetical protein
LLEATERKIETWQERSIDTNGPSLDFGRNPQSTGKVLGVNTSTKTKACIVG